MSVRAAVERDLAEIAKRDKALAESGVAAAALELASQLDDSEVSATAKAACARALAESLDRLRLLVPAASESDALDELGARRSARLA